MQSQSPESNGRRAAAWGDLATAPLLQWFAEQVWNGLGAIDRRRYEYMLARFANQFRRMPDHRQIVDWLQTLPQARGEGIIELATKVDYYKRFQFVYRRALADYPPARDLQPLPYHSFRPKQWDHHSNGVSLKERT